MNRDLDLLVAKEIFGWNSYERVGKDANGENEGQVLVPHSGYLDGLFKQGYTFPNVGKIHEGYLAPQYSSNFYSAMEVVRKVKLPTPAYELPSNPEELVKLAYSHFKTATPSQNQIPVLEVFKGTKYQPLQGVFLACISPEARDLLDKIMKNWKEYKKDYRKKLGKYPSDYGFAYWLVRYSGLIQPLNVPSPIKDMI